MSALLPTDTKEESPIPSAWAWSITASPSAPLWERKPTRPAGGKMGPKEALRRTWGSVLRIPMQLGPISRIPCPATDPEQLGLAQGPIRSGLREARRDDDQRADALGRVLTSNGRDRLFGDDDHPKLNRAGDLADRRVGGKPEQLSAGRVDRVDGTPEPGPDKVRDDPASDRPRIPRCSDDSDRVRPQEGLHRRPRRQPVAIFLRRASGEREVGNSIRISPEPDRLRIGNPLSRKTSSIWRFSPRIVASNSSIPVADAVAASWPRRIVPRPRPCISSATAKPTSARWGLTVP
jgi:hypothetical protein